MTDKKQLRQHGSKSPLDLSTIKTVAVLGECMLELSSPDPESPDLKKMSFGGDTLNTAFYLAASGQQVSYFTALGNDPQSHWMMQQWHDAGIDCDHVRKVAGRLPGLYMIETDAAGARSFLYWRDNSPARELFDDPQQSTQLFAELRQFDLLYLSGVTLSLYADAALDKLLGFLADFRRQGGLIAFDSNYRPERWPNQQRAHAVYKDFYQQVDLALPTLEDDATLFNLPAAEDLFETLANLGVAEAVVKQGGKGSLVEANQGIIEIPAINVDDIVDTTGAGDSFNGGYLCARMNGESRLKAAVNGHRYAAQVIQQYGAIVPINLN